VKEEDCASEENMETRFVLGDFQRHMELRKKKKWERWRENSYKNGCRSLYTVWKESGHHYKQRIVSTSSCRIPHPTGCYQIRFTYLFSGELNYNSYKNISGPGALMSQYW